MYDKIEALWHGVGAVVALSILVFFGVMFSAEHKVDGYYLSKASNDYPTGSCVYAHWNWHNDEKAFCTPEYKDALEFVERANATVKH